MLPRSFVAGDSFNFEYNDVSHPASQGWAAQFVIMTTAPTLIAGVADGDAFDFSMDSATSALIVPGEYGQALVFTKAGKRETVSLLSVIVLPNPVVASAPSWAMMALTECETAIRNWAKGSNAQVSINGETYTKKDIDKLLTLRNYLATVVASELKLQGKPTRSGFKTIVTEFSS
jgi:hypothetical protein